MSLTVRRESGEPIHLDSPLTVREAAGVLRCSPSFIYKLMKQGEIAYERRGWRKLPVRQSVEEYRQRNVVAARRVPEKAAGASPPRPYRHLFQRGKAAG